MAFFLPSSTSSSTTTSLSSSPLPVLRQLDSDDESRQSHDGNGSSLRHRRSDDSPSTQSGFTMFGLLSRRIEYISGASASDISSLESGSESEVESWTRRADDGDEAVDEFDDDDDDDRRSTNTRRTSRSTRDARRGRSPDNNNIQVHDDDHPVVELSVGTSRNHGAAAAAARAITTTTTTTDHHTGPSTITSEPNVVVVASPTNQVEGEETVKRRRNRTTRHGSREVDRSRARRVKPRNRRRDSHVYEAFISRDFFLVVTLCFGLACAWMVLVRPIMMNWFGFVGSRSGGEYMYMDG